MPPFRAEHIGSLLRPAALKHSFQRYREGQISAADHEAVLWEAIREAVLTQESAGFQSITDGEFGRNSWFGFFFERMGGFRLEPSAFQFRDAEGGPTSGRPAMPASASGGAMQSQCTSTFAWRR